MLIYYVYYYNVNLYFLPLIYVYTINYKDFTIQFICIQYIYISIFNTVTVYNTLFLNLLIQSDYNLVKRYFNDYKTIIINI